MCHVLAQLWMRSVDPIGIDDIAEDLSNGGPRPPDFLIDPEALLDLLRGRGAVENYAQHNTVFKRLCSALGLR